MAFRPSSSRFGPLLPCFFLSGFAALVYQTAWTRQFALVFGASPPAVAAVLAAYMGGLAAGAALAGRFVERLRRPLLAYALLEAGVALSALALPIALDGVSALQAWLFGGLPELSAEVGTRATLFHLSAAFVLLAIPTALMGMTLPVLVRQVVREQGQIASRVGTLYGLNTAGAVCGVMAAGFWLLPDFGLGDSVRVAAGSNAVAGLLALALSRGASKIVGAAPAEDAGSPRSWILPLVCVAGVASFGYEVLWSRLFAQLLGGGLAGFAITLASFLTGIALGAVLATRVSGGAERALRAFALTQIGVALCSGAAFVALDALPALLRDLAWQGSPARGGALAAGLLLPATLCIGASFPLAVRALARSAGQAGSASARVFAWNTLGSILGAAGAGFWLLPALGSAAFAGLLVALNLLVAAGALCVAPRRGPWIPALGGFALLLLLFVPPRTPWAVLRTSGLSGEAIDGRVAHHGLGRSAAVLLSAGRGGWRLYADGLHEAQVKAPGTRPGGNPLAQWLGGLPVWARPEARRMLVVGLGGGVLLESLPASLDRIDVLEIEEEILAANRVIAERRRKDPLVDPRVHVWLGDARGLLSRTTARYDLIVSQPSHPWTEGSGPLFTREFFELLRAHLSPGGVFAQWMAARFVDEDLLRGLLATLVEVFPEVRVYHPVPGGLVILASEAPLRVEQGAARALSASPGAFADLGVHGAQDVLAAWLLDEAGSRALSWGGMVNRDDHNPLQMRSEAVMRAGGGRPLDFLIERDVLVGPASESSRLRVVEILLARGFPLRAGRVAAAASDPALRAAGRALVASARGRFQLAAAAAEEALRAEAPSPEIRAALLSLRVRGGLDDRGDLEALAAGLGDPAAALVEALRAASRADMEALRALEARLAGVAPGGRYYADALRMRIRWRLDDPTPASAREALRLADRLVPVGGRAGDWLLRVRAVAAGGDAAATEAALFEAVEQVRRGDAPAVRGALEVLARLPPEPGAERRRAGLAASLRALLR